MAMTPTARTLDWLRKSGYTAGVVEKWIPQTRQRRDFLGAIDIIGVRSNPKGTVGVQATSGSNVSSRVTKILGIPAMRTWVEAGNELWVVGWRLAGKAGKRKLWTPRVVPITFEGDSHFMEL